MASQPLLGFKIVAKWFDELILISWHDYFAHQKEINFYCNEVKKIYNNIDVQEVKNL